MHTTDTPDRVPITSSPAWPCTVEIGKPGSSLKLMVTASVICSASTPRPDPRIIAPRGLKPAGIRARMMSAAWNGELLDMEILCFFVGTGEADTMHHRRYVWQIPFFFSIYTKAI